MIKNFIQKCNIKDKNELCGISSKFFDESEIKDCCILSINKSLIEEYCLKINEFNIEYIIIEDVFPKENFLEEMQNLKNFSIKFYDFENKCLLLENLNLRKKLINLDGYWTHDNDNDHIFDNTLADELINMCKFKTVADLGCGNAQYVKYLNDNDCYVTGYDGNPNVIKYDNCHVLNLTKNIKFNKKYDVVLCLEVGEHIPEQYENILINNIVKICKNKLIISWAVPEQEGFGHINCKENKYIIDLIEEKKFKYSNDESEQLRLSSSQTWFKNTIMVFNKEK